MREAAGSIPGNISWTRERQPILELLPGKSLGRRGFVGYSQWGRRESDVTEGTTRPPPPYSAWLLNQCLLSLKVKVLALNLD